MLITLNSFNFLMSSLKRIIAIDVLSEISISKISTGNLGQPHMDLKVKNKNLSIPLRIAFSFNMFKEQQEKEEMTNHQH